MTPLDAAPRSLHTNELVDTALEESSGLFAAQHAQHRLYPGSNRVVASAVQHVKQPSGRYSSILCAVMMSNVHIVANGSIATIPRACHAGWPSRLSKAAAGGRGGGTPQPLTVLHGHITVSCACRNGLQPRAKMAGLPRKSDDGRASTQV